MAPSSMFSKLRPGHNKRNASSTTLASPVSDIPAQSLPLPSLLLPPDESHAEASHVSAYPPQLPPIPRVASQVDRTGAGSTIASPQRSAGEAIDETEGMRPPFQSVEGVHENRRPASSGATSSHQDGLRTEGQSAAPVVELASPSETPTPSSSSFLSISTLSANYSSHSKSQSSLLSGISDRLSSASKSAHLSTPTAPPRKTGRLRRGLRKPISLLMSRRSSQPLDNLVDEPLVTQRSPPPSNVPPIPENDDPSIRGRIVHDFSAPRPKRNLSYGGEQDTPQASDNATEPGWVSPQRVERGHTPVFREHFDDDTSYEGSQAAVRAEKLANKGFVARNSWQPPLPLPPPPGRSPPPPPPLPKDSPPESPPPQPITLSPNQEQPPTRTQSVLSPVQEASNPIEARMQDSPPKRKSTKTPPSTRSRATSITDPPFVPAGLPKHLTSTASRFSFQIAGSESAEEKILEERHMRKAAEKASKQSRMSTNTLDDEYDAYDMDDYDVDGGLEEDIPMIGEDDELHHASMSPGMSAFDFSTPVPGNINTMSPVMLGGGFQTPCDANGLPIGFAVSDEMLQMSQALSPSQSVHEPDVPVAELQGLGLTDANGPLGEQSNLAFNDAPEDAVAAAATKYEPQELDFDDDMYFDDGMIEEQGNGDAGDFDEDVFDDPNSVLYERKVKSPSTAERATALRSNPPDIPSSDTGYDADEDDLTRLNNMESSLAHTTSMAHRRPIPDFNGLQAYHNKLANAAQRAQSEGRFVRKASVVSGQGSDVDDSSSLSNSRPSLIPDDGRTSQETTGCMPDDDVYGMSSSFVDDGRTSQETTGCMPDDDVYGMSSSFVDDYEYSEYDSALEDDPMIAEANAEALANDYEGFYGQEFGFYANAQGESFNAYGGFFGSSALGRSVSGRNAVREPNLTPITERSEYSTRNSFVSLNHFRDGQQPLASPGLAQLSRISPYGWLDDDPDMSLDSLMKLRKGAFGTGSAISLVSSTGNSPRNSSPMGMQYVPRNASPMTNYPTLSRHDSSEGNEGDDSAYLEDQYDGDEYDDALDAVNELPEEYDDNYNEGSRPESPTLNASDYNNISSDYNSLSSPYAHHNISLSPVLQPYHQSLKSPPQPLTLSTALYDNTNLSSPGPAPSTTSSVPNRQSLGLVSPVTTSSPMTPSASGWKAGHSRIGSGADSVAYVKELDEDGGDHWVLERRRTAESGELELVGREIIEGGRI